MKKILTVFLRWALTKVSGHYVILVNLSERNFVDKEQTPNTDWRFEKITRSTPLKYLDDNNE